ncbi:MAG: hypothetical protein AB2784_15865, partial [Candidatus Thiodiazotropha endolucinida]
VKAPLTTYSVARGALTMIIINTLVVIIIMLLSVVHAIFALLENLNFHSFCFVNLFTGHLTSV